MVEAGAATAGPGADQTIRGRAELHPAVLAAARRRLLAHRRGYLEGARARTWISPYFVGGPTLITYSDRSRITITGDLTRQELIDVANSFKAYGDVERPLPKGYGK